MEDFQKRDIVTHAIESSPSVGGALLTERRCQLTILNGQSTGKTIEIQSSPLRIGKGASNEVQLSDPTVSREHFVLTQEAGGFLVRDLGSTNGTWIEQMRIREAYLRPGVIIRAGDVQLRFEPLFKPVEVSPTTSNHFGSLVGLSVAMRQIFALLDRVSRTDATVIILGETGTGKGAVARAIHERSARCDKPFVVVDCGAIAENLIESELFGHERGAFTGATASRQGALEQAAGGTLFIDELIDLRLDLQPKLLRALEEREFRRLGSNKPLRLDARVIAASKRDLWAEVQAGHFREDLYFRLAVFTIPLPPLRDRLEDIALLVERFAREMGVDDAMRARLGPETLTRLMGHDWPGNIRELRNAVERVLYFGENHADPLLGPIGSIKSSTPRGAAPNILSSGVQYATPTQAPLVPVAAPAAVPAPVPIPVAPIPVAAHQPAADVFAAPVSGQPALQADYSKPFKAAKEELLDQFEAEYIRRLLVRCNGQISLAAREAEIDRKHLYNLMKKYAIDAGDSRGN